MNFQITNLNAKWESYHSRRGEPYRHKNKLYIWPEGETVMENLFNRHNRPAKVWKESVIPAVLQKLAEQFPEIYEKVKNNKWGWRRKCGCSMCPCSPGFVSDGENKYTISASVKFSD